ncbi:MAG: ABC transporter substrate-binding protein [Roseburia sp.]|nr:ABC transporter substrate-binding protein [Roseburia sp.]MCM1242674.1 ABC transporter substrate-binding protein [Roseburia sp.]
MAGNYEGVRIWKQVWKRFTKGMAGGLAVLLLAVSLTGCGNTGGDGFNTGTGPGDGGREDIENGELSDAMGRYVEETMDLSGKISGSGNRLYQLDNGNLMISDSIMDFVKADGDGKVWMADVRRWRTRMIDEGTYIMSMAVGADNTVALIYQGEMDEAEEAIELNPQMLIIKPDNTEIPVEVAITKDDQYLNQVYIADDGRIFVSTRGTSNIYEVKEDGSSDLFLMVEEGCPNLIRFHDNIMAIDGYGYDGLLLYDMDKKEYIEDEVLNEFVNENYKNRGESNLDTYDLYFFFGEDDIIYLAGEKGLYRHVIGGSVMEQVIDGKLCSLGNPSYALQGMIALDNSEFLTLFQGGQLVRYVYDPDIPTVPHEKLMVYGLYDNELIRQAINIYQTQNPQVYIEFTCGMSGSDSVTREDALKSLNTKIMAGEGPDILILDNMPVDSYVEKGLLLDLSQMIGGLSGEDELFGNIVGAFTTDEQIYAMPCAVRLPVMMADKKYLNGVYDLTDVADMVEALKEDYPEQDLLGISSAKGIMRLFAMSCVPAWMNAEGEIDKEAIGEFLEQTGRIYAAQTDGVPDRVIDRYEEISQAYETYNRVASFEDSDYLRMPNMVKMKYVGGYTQSLFGVFECMDVDSIQKLNGFENAVWAPMGGQCENVFWAKTLLGINAASEQIQLAEDFLKVCLGKENQSYLYDSLPVNKAAFDEKFTTPEGSLDGSRLYNSVATEGEDGQMISLVCYWPSEEEFEVYKNYMETVDTAYIEDDVLENVVYEEGISYMQGSKSLEEAVNDIEKKVSIYMAE